MKKKFDKKLVFMFFYSFIFIYACDPIHTLNIENKTNEDIFLSISYDGNLIDYPIKFGPEGDTLWDMMEYMPAKEGTILPLIGRNGWKYGILRNSPDSTLTIFYYKRSFLETVRQDSIVPNQVYSNKITYKLKELEVMNWVIDYK